MEKITLNIGCGERTFKEYPKGHKCINVDERDLNNVDKVMDVRKLDFPDEYFDYIIASDIIEHFPISETENILKEWKRILKVGGIIEFRMPNLEAVVSDYLKRKDEDRSDVQGGIPISQYFSWLLYGGQDYSGNFHYVCFDRRLFKYTIEQVGLKEINWKKEGYNMIIKTKKDK